jgi:hypothetical protein
LNDSNFLNTAETVTPHSRDSSEENFADAFAWEVAQANNWALSDLIGKPSQISQLVIKTFINVTNKVYGAR